MILQQQLIQSKTLCDPSISSQQRSSKHKQLHLEPERPSDNPDPSSKRPRTDKNRLIEHWTRNEFTWPEKLPESNPMAHFLARSNTPSLRRTKSNSSLTTATETSSREAKSRSYTNKNYDTYLKTKGCFMYDHDDGELIVPSAESAIDLSLVTFPHLVVSVNEGWDSSISLDED
ncbi:hypothetical protein AJ78_07588 [Emergomyces pasteurianus Ep9510]|uniref:Uncharacterized protein n=1 Tax=Emergomyces pasteurianus Ep9510 TaxID=1447872 RepID=A0A1J9P4Q4_9EURO|nr:hypothetical protein AJ78_07588 [Emergomyces pasteurianus Ep9510]